MLSWQLSLLALLLLPANVLILYHLRPRVEQRTRIIRQRASDLTAFFMDNLGAMKFIQAVAAEQREREQLGRIQERFRREMLGLQMTNYSASALPGVLISLTTALVFVLGGYQVTSDQMSVGTLIAFSVYLARATGPVQTLQGLWIAARRARVSLDRVMELTLEQARVRPPAVPKQPRTPLRGKIRFESVCFRYREEGPDILRNLNLTLAGGEKVALQGLSGVGKTTLVDLLLRHYDPTRGRIRMDGIDLRELDLQELRRHVAVVAQDTILFNTSILDNIRYARPDVTEARVVDAAKRARVDEFAERLPQGYATAVGTRGQSLSGGQRQRVAIARALLQDPLILVLDEATAAVDETTETQIVQAVDELFHDRTRLVISHRASTLRGADRTLELRGGQLQPVSS
jgi:ATP-binding cassette subfamily B protein